MVDQNVLSYISRYYKSYPLIELKRKILSQGYSEEDFRVSLELLGINPDLMQGKKNNKYKWMKTAGIIGIIFLIFSFISVIWLYFSFPTELAAQFISQPGLTSPQDQSNSAYYTLSVILIVVILLIFFFYGFVVMGRKTETKTLKICSWINITLIILVSLALGSLFIYGYLNPDSESMGSYELNSPDNSSSISSIIPIGIAIALLILLITSSIGLIFVGNKVKFIKIAGILKIIYTLMIVGGSGFFIYNITKNEELAISLVSALLGLSGETIFKILMPYIVVAIISIVLILIVLLLLSLGLLNASRRYE